MRPLRRTTRRGMRLWLKDASVILAPVGQTAPWRSALQVPTSWKAKATTLAVTARDAGSATTQQVSADVSSATSALAARARRYFHECVRDKIHVQLHVVHVLHGKSHLSQGCYYARSVNQL